MIRLDNLEQKILDWQAAKQVYLIEGEPAVDTQLEADVHLLLCQLHRFEKNQEPRHQDTCYLMDHGNFVESLIFKMAPRFEKMLKEQS